MNGDPILDLEDMRTATSVLDAASSGNYDPAAIVALIYRLKTRLSGLSVHTASRGLHSSAWRLSQTLIGTVVPQTMIAANYEQRVVLAEAVIALQQELCRLHIVGRISKRTGSEAFLTDELPTCPDYPPVATQ
jgi:hypothetical protein